MNLTLDEKQKKSAENLTPDRKSLVRRDEKGRLLPGEVLNPTGIQGERSFRADFDEICQEIADLNKISISEARKILIRKAYAEAKNGKFPYYQDIMDRYFGRAPQNLHFEGEMKLPLYLPGELLEKNDISPSPEQNSEGSA